MNKEKREWGVGSGDPTPCLCVGYFTTPQVQTLPRTVQETIQ